MMTAIRQTNAWLNYVAMDTAWFFLLMTQIVCQLPIWNIYLYLFQSIYQKDKKNVLYVSIDVNIFTKNDVTEHIYNGGQNGGNVIILHNFFPTWLS